MGTEEAVNAIKQLKWNWAGRVAGRTKHYLIGGVHGQLDLQNCGNPQSAGINQGEACDHDGPGLYNVLGRYCVSFTNCV